MGDVGLAKQVKNTASKRSVGGTVAYVAPEVRSGKVQYCSLASDVFSLSSILVEMTTRKATFGLSDIELKALVTNATTKLDAVLQFFDDQGDLNSEMLHRLATACQENDPLDRCTIAEIQQLRQRCKNDSAQLLDGVVPGKSSSKKQMHNEQNPFKSRSSTERQTNDGKCDGSIVSLIMRALEIGVPAFNSGNHLACYQCYLNCSIELLSIVDQNCQHVLREAMSTSSASNLINAKRAWILRDALDNIIRTVNP